jgi:hypothetical protein
MANYVFQLLLALVAISDYRLTHKKKFAEEVAILDYRLTHTKKQIVQRTICRTILEWFSSFRKED